MHEQELDRLFQAFDEACTEDPQVRRECLEESGIDHDELVEEGLAVVDKSDPGRPRGHRGPAASGGGAVADRSGRARRIA